MCTPGKRKGCLTAVRSGSPPGFARDMASYRAGQGIDFRTSQCCTAVVDSSSRGAPHNAMVADGNAQLFWRQ
jgi:hypothetical protein